MSGQVEEIKPPLGRYVEAVWLSEISPDEQLVGCDPTPGFLADLGEKGLLHPVVLQEVPNAGVIQEGYERVHNDRVNAYLEALPEGEDRGEHLGHAINAADAELPRPVLYQVLDGRRRVKAARKLDQEYIRATIYGPEVDAAAFTLAGNFQRHDNPLSELGAVRAMEKQGFSEGEIANRIHAPVQKLRSLRKVAANLLPDLFVAVEAGKIAFPVGAALANKPVGVQQRALARFQEQGTLKGADVTELSRAEAVEAGTELGNLFAEIDSLSNASPATQGAAGDPFRVLDKETPIEAFERILKALTAFREQHLKAVDAETFEGWTVPRLQTFIHDLGGENFEWNEIWEAARTKTRELER